MRAQNETYLPGPARGQSDEVDEQFNQLRAQLSAHEGDQVELVVNGASLPLPPQVPKIIHQVALAMTEGLAVSVIPHSLSISTQEAADILDISRPTLVRMLEAGKIPYEQRNRHRRLLLGDVVAFRDRQRKESAEALADLVADAELTDAYSLDTDEVRAALKKARKG